MIEIEVPGWRRLRLEHAIFDVNGTLARDGVLLPGVEERITRLRGQVRVHLLTADTHGQQAAIDSALGLRATIIRGGAEDKLHYIQMLDIAQVAAIGNGANDGLMLAAAGLGIAVLGPEGLANPALQAADVLVASITDALDLLLMPRRLVATLRR